MGRVAMIALFVCCLSPAVSAQRLVTTSSSVGAFTGASAGGGALFADVTTSFLPALPLTSVVGEIQAFPVQNGGVNLLGGIRQRFLARPQGDVYGQVVFGLGTHSERCDVCSAGVVQVGLGLNVPVNDGWAVRVRGDMGGGGSAGDMPLLVFGVGIERYWGSR